MQAAVLIFLFDLLTSIGGRPKHETCFLWERLRCSR